MEVIVYTGGSCSMLSDDQIYCMTEFIFIFRNILLETRDIIAVSLFHFTFSHFDLINTYNVQTIHKFLDDLYIFR